MRRVHWGRQHFYTLLSDSGLVDEKTPEGIGWGSPTLIFYWEYLGWWSAGGFMGSSQG